MALSNAERQARYRERHRDTAVPKAPRDAAPLVVALQRIAELEAEVHHLKRELAKRPSPPLSSRSFGSPRPAPKPSRSRSRTSASGRAG